MVTELSSQCALYRSTPYLHRVRRTFRSQHRTSSRRTSKKIDSSSPIDVLVYLLTHSHIPPVSSVTLGTSCDSNTGWGPDEEFPIHINPETVPDIRQNPSLGETGL